MPTNKFTSGSQTFSQSGGTSLSQKVVIRRMTRKDKSAKYVVKSASITKKQYNSKTQKQTTTKQQYRFVEEKK